MALPFVRICWHIHLPFFLCKAWVICLGYYGALQLVKLVQVLIYRPNSRGVHPPTPLALHSVHFCTIFQNIQQRDDRMQYTAEWHDIQQSDRIYGVKHQVRFSGISPFEHFQKFSFPFTFFQSLQVGQNFNITFFLTYFDGSSYDFSFGGCSYDAGASWSGAQCRAIKSAASDQALAWYSSSSSSSSPPS